MFNYSRLGMFLFKNFLYINKKSYEKLIELEDFKNGGTTLIVNEGL